MANNVHEFNDANFENDVEKSDLNRHKVLNSGSILKSTALEAEKGISTETEVIASETPTKVVANYLNGKIVESDEDIYARAWNAWASAWNGTLSVDERSRMAAPKYDEMKEMR